METMNTSRRVCNPNGLLDVTGSSSRGKRGRDEEDYATDPAYIQETENPPKRRLLSVFVEVANRLFSWVGGSNSESSLEHKKSSHSTECLSHEFKPETTDEYAPNRLDRITKDEKDETLIVVEDTLGARDGADIFDDLSPILMSETKSTSNGLSYSTDLSPKVETTIIYSESDEEFSEHSLSIDDAAVMTTSSRNASPRKLNANQETVYHSESTDIRRTPQRDSTEPIIIDDSDDELPVKLLRSPFVRSTFRGKPNSVQKILASGGFRKSRKSPLFEDRRKKHVKTITRELLNACVPFSQAKDLGYSGSEREYADFTDYARQVYEASIGAGPQDEVFISNFFSPRQEIETKQKTSTQRKAPVSETPTPTKKIRERTLPTKLESWGEEQWLKNLRERIEKAHLFKSPEDRPFTPIFDKLKQQDLLLDQLIDEQREKAKPKRNNFPELSEEAYETIEWALGPGSEDIVEGFNVTLSKSDIQTLKDGKWLNDEIMNFYGNLIMERAKQSQSSYPEIHVFNTFFYSTLRDKGYQKIRRWSRKFNIFKKDYIIIPVHLGMHWVCAIINFVQKRIEYYDSMHGNNPQCFQLLRHYLEEESLDKLGQPFDLSDWIDYAPKNIPSQQNGFDCGVFTCMFAEYISRNEPFDFNQKHMKYIRRRMIWEIIQKHLVNQ